MSTVPYIDPILSNEIEVKIAVRDPRFIGTGKIGTSFRMDAATATFDDFKVKMANATEAIVKLYDLIKKEEGYDEQFLQQISEHPF